MDVVESEAAVLVGGAASQGAAGRWTKRTGVRIIAYTVGGRGDFDLRLAFQEKSAQVFDEVHP